MDYEMFHAALDRAEKLGDEIQAEFDELLAEMENGPPEQRATRMEEFERRFLALSERRAKNHEKVNRTLTAIRGAVGAPTTKQ